MRIEVDAVFTTLSPDACKYRCHPTSEFEITVSHPTGAPELSVLLQRLP